jgi:hypothetical protein
MRGDRMPAGRKRRIVPASMARITISTSTPRPSSNAGRFASRTAVVRDRAYLK